MNAVKMISGCLCVAVLSGCASIPGAQGPRGPKLVGSGYASEYGNYGGVGVEFSSLGDFVALASPKRWTSPFATGGTLSWMNPGAWSDDPGRTGRILVGQAVVVGGAVAATSGGGGGGGGDSFSDNGGTANSDIGSPPSIPSAPPE